MKGFVKKIYRINFGLMSPEDIRSMSTVTVEYPDTFGDDGFPIEKGLMDPRMGVIDSSLVCRTCGFRGGDCQGHFGTIELARPVIHVGFAETIYKLLRSTCNECGRILLSNEKIEYYINRITELMDNRESLNDILDEIYELTNQGVKDFPMDDGTFESRSYCPHCGSHQKPIYFDKPLTIRQGYYRLTPSDVRDRLEKITDEDAFVLGVNPEVARPEWMVLTVLPVPPVNLRPPIYLSDSERLENDLTLKLREILRINQRLLENMESGAPNFIIEDLWDLLQYHVTTYFNNRTEGVPISKNRIKQPLNTLIQQINDSFEYRLLNKPMNHVASSIVSPDPNISINEVGIPKKIAKEMTVPVHVNEWNIGEMRTYIENGPEVHPGANYVINGNTKRRITEDNKEFILINLEPGYIIERHLKDSDIVLLSNESSKTKTNMLAHEVRVLPYDTIRLNPAVCSAYDVAFDGCEININVLQNIESKAESKELLMIQENLISPSIGGPIIGGLSDHILGLFLLTRNGVEFSQEEVFQIIRKCHLKMPKFKSDQLIFKYNLNFGDESFIFKKYGENLSGKEVFSLLLPNDLNLLYESSFSSFMSVNEYEDSFVVIEDGILKQGVIDKESFGLVIGKILNSIVKDYGSQSARDFINFATILSLYSASKFGITTSLNDYEIPNEVKNKIETIINNKLINLTVHDNFDLILEDISASVFEIIQEYHKTQYLSDKNNFNSLMVSTQSHLSSEMVNSISAFVGQQHFNSKKSYNRRLLPHFKKDDVNENRGFIKSSYLKGLSPTEYFMNAVNHRAKQIDENMASSKSRILMKNLTNSLQDLTVKPSGLVTDNNGNIIQTVYGEDNVFPAKSDFGRVVDLDRLIDDILINNDKENLNSESSEYDIYRDAFKNLKNILKDFKNMSKSILTLEVESVELQDLNGALNNIIPLINEVLDSDDETEILKYSESYKESYTIFKSIYDEEMENIQDELVKHQNKIEINNLIKKIGSILTDFKKLKTSIDDCNLTNKEIKEIKFDVESNIRLLESMLNSNDIEELRDVVNDSLENYSNLSSNFKKSLDKDKIINLKNKLGEYSSKINGLRISLNESSFKDSVKRDLNFEIDSLSLLLDNSQNFDDVDRLSEALNRMKSSYKSISNRLNIKDASDVIDGEILTDCNELLSKFKRLDYEANNKNLDFLVLKILNMDINHYITLLGNLDGLSEEELRGIILEAEESYESIVETIKAKETNEINYYKSELKFLLSQFEQLYKKVPDIESNSIFNDFKERIKYNINLIDSSLRLRKIEKLKDKLEQITKNYNSIDSDLSSELDNIGKKELGAQFRSELKGYLSKFKDLEKEVPNGSDAFDEIRLEINSNIDIINSSLKYRKIEKLKTSLDNAKENYSTLNESLNEELKNFDSKTNINNLKKGLEEYLNKFNELHDKISNMDEKNRNLSQIDKKITSKIDVLKSAYRLRKAEKLQSLLDDVTRFYKNINKEIEIELTKINYNTQVKELKIQLNNYIPKFDELKEKISSAGAKTSELKSISEDIDNNIGVLKSSSRLRKLEKVEERLVNVQKNYSILNQKVEEELVKIEMSNEYSKNLKLELKNYLSLFEELYEQTKSEDAENSNLKKIKENIKSNIKVLKSSSRLKKIDKLENRLENAKIEYDKLSSDLDSELKYLKNNNQIQNELKAILLKFEKLEEDIHNLYVLDIELEKILKKVKSKLGLIKTYFDSQVKDEDVISLKSDYNTVENEFKLFKDSFYSINGKFNKFNINIDYPNDNKILKLRIKKLISYYKILKNVSTLKSRTDDLADNNSGFNIYLFKSIELNIELLNKASRFRKTEKLINSLKKSSENYVILYYKYYNKFPDADVFNINPNLLDDTKISTKKSSKKNKKRKNSKKSTSTKTNNRNKSKVLIKENANRIINLRKKFKSNPVRIRELSEISFTNNTLSSKLKNGKPIKYADVLNVKVKLDELESNFISYSSSSKSKETKKLNVNNSENNNSIKNQEKSQTVDEFIINVNTLKDKSNAQLNKYRQLKNRLKKILMQNKVYEQINTVKIFNNDFDSYLKSVEKLNNDVYEFEHIINNYSNLNISKEKGRYLALNGKLMKYSHKYIEFDKKIKIFNENNQVLNQKGKCNELIDKINEFFKFVNQISNSEKKVLKEYSNELIIIKKYFSRLERDILSIDLKTISNGKYDNNIALRLNEIDVDLDSISEKNSSLLKDNLLMYLYSLTGRYGILSSFRTKFSAEALVDDDIKNIRAKITEEINSDILKNHKDIKSRIEILIEDSQKINDDLLKYVDTLECESKSNISTDICEQVKDKIKTEIKLQNIKNENQIKIKFNKLLKEETAKHQTNLYNYLYDIIGEYTVKRSFIDENDLSMDDAIEIKNKLKKGIFNCELNTSEEIQSQIYNLVYQKQLDDIEELVNYSQDAIKYNGMKFSFKNKFSTYDLSFRDFNEIRSILKKEIKSKNLKNKGDIDSKICDLINQKINEKYSGLLEEFYEIVGKNGLSNSFLTKLSYNDLNEINGNYIKQNIESKINNHTIENKLNLKIEIEKLISDECKRQNKAIDKLNKFFINDNAYLFTLSSEDKQEIKNSTIESIKKNRLDEKEVYNEFKKIIEEYKQNKKGDDTKTNEPEENSSNESKSSGGLMSRLKRLFS